jgi:hypothetical protein
MTIRYSPNTPVTTYEVQSLLYYHWLVFCNNFTEVETNGVWSYSVAGSDGIISSLTPSTFVSPSGPFLSGHASGGYYLAIQDNANPANNTIAKIVSYTSATTVQLNSGPTTFTVNSTGVSFRIINPATIPGLGDYFVIQNPIAVNQPAWQAKITVRSASPFVTGIQFAPIGGWNTSTSLWTLPVCVEVGMYATIAQSFMLSDPDQGWVFFWTEDTGGIGSNRKGCWFGSLSPFHAPRTAGVPSDNYFGAVFGDITMVIPDNFSRNTAISTNICVGQTMNYDTTIIPIYWAQKRLIGSGTDTNTLAGAVSPRTGEADDYDVIAFQRSTSQAFRGRVPGMRLLSENLVNRTGINSLATYVISDGIGVAWSGKVII